MSFEFEQRMRNKQRDMRLKETEFSALSEHDQNLRLREAKIQRELHQLGSYVASALIEHSIPQTERIVVGSHIEDTLLHKLKVVRTGPHTIKKVGGREVSAWQLMSYSINTSGTSDMSVSDYRNRHHHVHLTSDGKFWGVMSGNSPYAYPFQPLGLGIPMPKIENDVAEYCYNRGVYFG